MTFLPVIGREIRAAARQPFTYYLRTISAGALILASLFFGLNARFTSNLGPQLFMLLHFTLFWAIWVIVPLLAADCISRERREGTLGLLFLTELKAQDIVIAKGFTHGIRAVTLWLAVLPVLTVPFVLGGISRTEAMMSFVFSSCAMCWALAAGILASASSSLWTRAIMRAAILAIVFLLLFAELAGWGLMVVLMPSALMTGNWFSESQLLAGVSFLANAQPSWVFYIRTAPPWQQFWLLAALSVGSLFVLIYTVRLAGGRTKVAWQDSPPSPRAIWWQRTFFTPVLWLGFFHRWMKRKLERNPIGWLEQRTWSGRLVVWAWFAVIISFYSAILTDQHFLRGSNFIQSVLAWLLAGSMAMAAAASFNRERETGVLELLLVSPLNEAQIIYGRLRGLWGQFAPAIAMLLGVWIYLMTFLPAGGNLRTVLFFGSTFFTVPVIGLFFSLHSRNFVTALVSTLAIALFLPLVLPGFAVWLFESWINAGPGFGWDIYLSFGGVICQLALAGLAWNKLHQGLKQRSFALDRPR